MGRMGDAGEGLVDAEARIAERLEERQRRAEAARTAAPRDPDALREWESLRLGRAELARQRLATPHAPRRAAIDEAMTDLDRRMAALRARLD